MTQDKKLTSLLNEESFDFNQYEQAAIEQLKSGQSLMGENGVCNAVDKTDN